MMQVRIAIANSLVKHEFNIDESGLVEIVITWPKLQPTLSAGSIELRPLSDRDFEAIYLGCQDPLISQFTPIPFPYDKQHAIDYVRASQFSYLDHTSMNFAIYYAENKVSNSQSHSEPVFAGTVGLHSLQQRDHMAEIGYWLSKEMRGKGICAHAVKTLANFALHEMGFRRIEALAALANEPSHRVLERAGFTRDSVLRDRTTRPDGSQIDMVLYSLTGAR